MKKDNEKYINNKLPKFIIDAYKNTKSYIKKTIKASNCSQPVFLFSFFLIFKFSENLITFYSKFIKKRRRIKLYINFFNIIRQ